MPAAAPSPVLVWFRDDLRLDDNPALAAAAAEGRPLALVYLLEEADSGLRPLGGAARWWLHHALASLAEDLQRLGQTLILRRGRAIEQLPAIAREIGAISV
ncbi:MAG: deoxyribodipyrimidine photo-lyase, partial [Bauldia sp.]